MNYWKPIHEQLCTDYRQAIDDDDRKLISSCYSRLHPVIQKIARNTSNKFRYREDDHMTMVDHLFLAIPKHNGCDSTYFSYLSKVALNFFQSSYYNKLYSEYNSGNVDYYDVLQDNMVSTSSLTEYTNSIKNLEFTIDFNNIDSKAIFRRFNEIRNRFGISHSDEGGNKNLMDDTKQELDFKPKRGTVCEYNRKLLLSSYLDLCQEFMLNYYRSSNTSITDMFNYAVVNGVGLGLTPYYCKIFSKEVFGEKLNYRADGNEKKTDDYIMDDYPNDVSWNIICRKRKRTNDNEYRYF
jgi:hypothetical protein